MAFSTKYTNLLNKQKIPIIIAWTVIGLGLTVFFAGNFFNVTTNNFSAPEGTDAYKANALLTEYFPEREEQISHILVATNPGSNILTAEFTQFTIDITSDIQHEYGSKLVSAQGYFLFAGTELDDFKDGFVSTDLSTSIIILSLDGDSEFQKESTEVIREHISSYEINSFKVYTTGFGELQADTDESIERDLATIDAIVIPIVFIALLILLRNYRYFPITLAPIALTIGLTFATLERIVVSTGIEIQSFVPSVIISMTLGVGVDYSLFLLTRFREERLNGKSVDDSVSKMLEHAGHTVFTSGLTLTIALVGLAFFPISILSSVGISISVAILILLAINLTLTPALLLLIGKYVEKDRTSEIEDSKSSPQPDSDTVQTKRGIFYRVGKFATKRNGLILGAVLLLTLPLAAQIVNSNPRAETAFFSPRGSSSESGFELLEQHFGPGIISPVTLIVVPNDNDAWGENTFDKIDGFIAAAISETQLERINFNSHVSVGGIRIGYFLSQALLYPNAADNNTIYDSQDAMNYRNFAPQYVNALNNSAFIEIVLPVDPSSPAASDLLKDLKRIADQTLINDFEYGFTGITAESSDMIASTYDLFPMMILFVVIGIYIFIGLMFRAVILPARLIATIALTISFIYGAATVVFEYDTFLNDLFPALDNIEVTFWMVPVMSFSIILGLGIDYDIFTIERIRENVWNGMENDEAIAEGLDKTARIITGAGIIMTIAFGGMMFSSSYILVQFGFVLAFSILMDTFVVRTLLVPAIMSFAEKMNWWPNLPPHLKDQ
ncbi:MAG: MMPL family transporter [Candidatus Heimdallarchaeota archaeon]|nr:MMPL family transporter [Candidatus Heimdallarchaeota archaeon]